MRILIATGIFPPEIGGPATYAALLAQELPKRGIEVDILPFRTVKKYPRVLRHLAYFFEVFWRSLKADIIFTQDPVSTGIPVVFAAFFSRKKVVLRVPGDYAWEQARQRFGVKDSVDEFQKKKYSFIVEVFKAMERFSVRHADVVITPSDYFNRLVKGWFSGGGGESVNTDKRTNKVITIYNGIDLNETFEKLPKYNEKTIISAGRLVPGKGFDLLIRIMKDMPEWKLHIVGEGPDEETLMRLAKDNSVESRVLFLGKLPRLELFSEIYRSHVFALLSESESFSFQIVEAMFVGTPVIATRVGAIPELIENGKDGILINRADSVNFRDEAERLVNDSYYATRISQNARLKVEHFSINNTVDQLYRICENVVAK